MLANLRLGFDATDGLVFHRAGDSIMFPVIPGRRRSVGVGGIAGRGFLLDGLDPDWADIDRKR